MRDAVKHERAQTADEPGEVLHDAQAVAGVGVADVGLAGKGLEGEGYIRDVVGAEVDKDDLVEQEEDGGVEDAVHVWQQELGGRRDLGQPSAEAEVAPRRVGAVAEQADLRVAFDSGPGRPGRLRLLLVALLRVPRVGCEESVCHCLFDGDEEHWSYCKDE